MSDAIAQLAHDHGELNRRVLGIGVQIRKQVGTDAIVEPLMQLRDHLFLHFAREEEGLFPFVTEHVPELVEQIHAIELAHDTICGALARMVHLASTGAALTAIAPLFDRFENSYATHAQGEAELFATLATRLDADQRAVLAALVEGL
jgi:hypothetical protein